MSTHGMAVQGVGGTADASLTQVGANIILPAGGPWLIQKIWGQACLHTPTVSESLIGSLVFNSFSGDIEPDPAPGVYPIMGLPGAMGANEPQPMSPLSIWDVDWSASGKATVQLSFLNRGGNTVAPEIACGIIFDSEPIVRRPLKFCDGVHASVAAAVATAIGTITLAEKATRIVGICTTLVNGAAVAASEESMGIITLQSDDIKLPPSQYPTAFCHSAALGTPTGACSCPGYDFIPLNIPVEGGARININITMSIAVTGGADVCTYIAYE